MSHESQHESQHAAPPPQQQQYANHGAHSQQHDQRLPLIVDIAIHNGKQLYQVHETAKLVRNEMPRSTNFSSNSSHEHAELLAYEGTGPGQIHQQGQIQALQGHQHLHSQPGGGTAARKVLGAVSPSSLNKKSDDGHDDEPSKEYAPMGNGLVLNVFQGYDQAARNESHDSQPSSATSTMSVSSFSRVQDNDIWSDDVEHAFEEVLSIIPKNGLNKIKISGRSCGRNELISDYIFTKTGKFRTRKQVSSHIQVIKNLGQKADLISLISDGPTFASEEEQSANTKRFEEIFSKINMSKSLGVGWVGSSVGSMAAGGGSFNYANRAGAAGAVPVPTLSLQHPPLAPAPPHPHFQNFFMSVTDSYAQNPIIISIQNNTDETPSLRIKHGTNLGHRFPGLADLQSHNMPVIHNMVKVLFPASLPYHYSWDGFKSNFMLSDETEATTPESIGSTDEGSSAFTAIYSYGQEVLKFTEPGFRLGQNREFLVKFWRYFLAKLQGKDEAEVASAFRGITIKQIVYDGEPGERDEQPEIHLKKSKIRVVLLWEFASVLEFKEAVTTTTKLILATRLESDDNVLPQVVEWDGERDPSLAFTPYEHSMVSGVPPGISTPVSAVYDGKYPLVGPGGVPGGVPGPTGLTGGLPGSLGPIGAGQQPQIQQHIQQGLSHQHQQALHQQGLHQQALHQQAPLQQGLSHQQGLHHPLQPIQHQQPHSQPHLQPLQFPPQHFSQYAQYSPQQPAGANVDLTMAEYPMYPDQYQFN